MNPSRKFLLTMLLWTFSPLLSATPADSAPKHPSKATATDQTHTLPPARP